MRVGAEYAAWWLALTAGYLELVTTPTGLEVPVGLVVAAAAAAAAVVGRRAFQPPVHVPSFVRSAVWLPLDLLADAVTMSRELVTGRAFRIGVGAVEEIDLPDDDATRAWAVLLVTAAPGSLAADVDERNGRLVLRRHRVTAHGRATAGLDGR
jgi:multisubunit Na+/H+ antiporter MnhE subunit